MREVIGEIVRHIKELSLSRQTTAKQLRKKSPELAIKIPEVQLDNLMVCGVDGGFLKKEYHGLNLILRRAVAVCFNYEQGKLNGVEYFPKRNPVPEPLIVGPDFSTTEFGILANLKRAEKELEIATRAVLEFQPSILILDGSVVLHPSSAPSKANKPLYREFLKIIEKYKELYKRCEEQGVLLAGVSEDSRAKKFCSHLAQRFPEKENILKGSTDTLFLCYMLNSGERTPHFFYSEKEELPILSEFGDWAKNIYGMYIKPVKFDRPLRVDFVARKNPRRVAEDISKIIWAISKQNRTYSYPSVLIEADVRAKLKEYELLVFKAAIEERLGRNPSLFELRREERPF